MAVAAPVFRGRGGKESVELVVEMAGRELSAASTANAGTGSLELLAVVADAEGHAKATEHGSLTMRMSPATRAAVNDYGLRVLSRLDVAPGKYLLRIAAVDSGGEAHGSVQYDLDVPALAKGSLTMSSVCIAAASDLRRPTTGSDSKWKDRFDEPPTASRAFSRDDEIEVSGEIYSTDASPIRTMSTVESASGTVVFSHAETLPTKPPTLRYHTAIALGSLDPGQYILSITAHRGANDPSVSRRVPFTVR
jgi:hypothetical protein